MNTGKKIKLIRTFRGLTQKELGEACGIHEVAIRKYELGKNIPKPEQLRKIAEALNVNVNSLVEFDIQADGDVLPLLFAIDEASCFGRLGGSSCWLPRSLSRWQQFFSRGANEVGVLAQ